MCCKKLLFLLPFFGKECTMKGERRKTLKELVLLDKFLFDETMDMPEAQEAALQIILEDVLLIPWFGFFRNCPFLSCNNTLNTV